MAKVKKKKLKNVQISNEELVPTTIGYLSSKQKGPFLLIFIFAILFATLYYMPQITNYVNKIFNPGLYAEMQEQNNYVEDSTGVMEELYSDLVLNISGVKFSNFQVSNDEISYKVDDSQSKDEFTNYYLETYDKTESLLERIPISSTSISTLAINYSNIKYISISKYEDGKYPSVNLKESKLTCTKDEESYEYEFQTGGLSKINYVFKMTRTDDNTTNFDEQLEKFELEASNNTNGVSVSFSQTENSFEFTKEEDLLVTSTSSLDNGYDYQTKAEQIAFEMSTKGYKCK